MTEPMGFGKTLVAVMVLAVTFGCAPSTKRIVPVRPFDLERYLGTWVEIARYDHRFERGLTHVTATYAWEGQRISILNRGFDPATGTWKTARGWAKVGRNPDEGALRVSFFRPFTAQYKVIALAPDYEWAVVTSGRMSMLWILARQRTLPEETLSTVLSTVQALGFSTDGLIMVDQLGDVPVD